MKKVMVDERMIAVRNAGSYWGQNFLVYALMLDVVWRGIKFHQAAWDLLGLAWVSCLITSVYQIKHRGLPEKWLTAGIVLLLSTAVLAYVLVKLVLS